VGPGRRGVRAGRSTPLITLYTIGFTRSSARSFFTRLEDAGVERVIDVRLSNSGQLAGFAKRADLAYFLERLGGIGYHHELALAPTPELLDAYRTSHDWAAYAKGFARLLRKRRVEDLPGARPRVSCAASTPPSIATAGSPPSISRSTGATRGSSTYSVAAHASIAAAIGSGASSGA